MTRAAARFVSDPELGHEVRVAGALDDRVELRTIVRREADAVQQHVAGPPAIIAGEHMVVDGNPLALLRHDDGSDHATVAVHGVAEVLDVVGQVRLDLGVVPDLRRGHGGQRRAALQRGRAARVLGQPVERRQLAVGQRAEQIHHRRVRRPAGRRRPTVPTVHGCPGTHFATPDDRSSVLMTSSLVW